MDSKQKFENIITQLFNDIEQKNIKNDLVVRYNKIYRITF